MRNKWISINIKPTWVGFAWFGWLMLEHVTSKKKVKVKACGTYCVLDGDWNMKFKIDWDRNDNLDDYDIIAYKTNPEKEINLFNNIGVFFIKYIVIFIFIVIDVIWLLRLKVIKYENN